MSKMAEVAKILGVELDEEFEVEDAVYGKKDRVRLTESGLEVFLGKGCCGGEGMWTLSYATMRDILVGRSGVRIVRKPWMPKDCDTFWTYYGDDFQVGEGIWEGCASDYARYKSGMVFRTKKEALAERPRVYKDTTGKEWRGEQWHLVS